MCRQLFRYRDEKSFSALRDFKQDEMEHAIQLALHLLAGPTPPRPNNSNGDVSGYGALDCACN